VTTCWTVRGSNPGGGEIFRTCPYRPWGPPSLLYNGYRVFPGGKERPGRDADFSPPSSAVGHERVKLYLHSPYGPYGLYRASVPVQGCTLLYFHVYSSGIAQVPVLLGETRGVVSQTNGNQSDKKLILPYSKITSTPLLNKYVHHSIFDFIFIE